MKLRQVGKYEVCIQAIWRIIPACYHPIRSCELIFKMALDKGLTVIILYRILSTLLHFLTNGMEEES